MTDLYLDADVVCGNRLGKITSIDLLINCEAWVIDFGDSIKEVSFPSCVYNGALEFVDEKLQDIALKTANILLQHLNENKIKDRENNVLGNLPAESYRFSISNNLKAGVCYGKVAKEIYLKCCNAFHWDESYAGFFGRNKILYAEQVAGPYSVWFVANSNLTDTESNLWKNIIKRGYIVEEYKTDDFYCYLDDVRITFIKNEKAEYIFGGIYKFDHKYRNEKDRNVCVYKKISETYPIQKPIE